ncbi:DUF6232 family protein [Actinoplanes solisilvae]|uniref:DUF6232 family protein n=1 Tax=Actinoplanes solisilvae TaxID=2486853 RepID=UPI000FD902D6|nr:DUF6232 family protein [Actinoplanes solisilvae]
MRTYYRGPGGLVTETHFVRVEGRLFSLDGLRDVGRVQRRDAYFVPVVVGAVTAVAAAAILALSVERPWAWVVVAAIAVGAVVVLSRSRLTYSLQATYQGVETELCSTTDAESFAKVCRALNRALQDSQFR